MESEAKSKLLNIKEAAKVLGLNVQRLRYEVYLGRIPHVKIGRSVLFTQVQLDQWIDSLKTGGLSEI